MLLQRKSEAQWARVEPRIGSSFFQVELQTLSFVEMLQLKPGWGHDGEVMGDWIECQELFNLLSLCWDLE